MLAVGGLAEQSHSANLPMAQSSGRAGWLWKVIDKPSRPTDHQSSWYHVS
jgi:hypothetical protein